MAARNKANHPTGTYIFGILIFVVLAVAILFGSGIDPQQKGQILRVFCAAGAGLVGSFIGGKVALKTRELPGWANIPITASGGFALFLIVFYGLGSGLPGEAKKQAPATNQPGGGNGPVAVPPKYDALKEGEATAGAWFAAFRGRDLDTLVKLASPPFYYDNQILLTKEEIRRKYSEFFKGPKDLSQIQVTKIQVMTVAELKKIGGAAGDRMLMSLRLTDDDIVAMIFIKKEAIGVYFRRGRTELEMAGWWD